MIQVQLPDELFDRAKKVAGEKVVFCRNLADAEDALKNKADHHRWDELGAWTLL